MKTIIATTALVLSLSAPTFADVSNAQAFFALGNDSAAERVVGDTSVGNVNEAQLVGASANESAAERLIKTPSAATRADSGLVGFFALGNDSAAERNVN